MSGSWWACHWCDWHAPIKRRLFDRRRATREFNQHLRECHLGVDYKGTMRGAVSGRPWVADQ